MKSVVKRCPICSTKLDKNGNCTWIKCPNYKTLEKTEDKESKVEKKD